MSGLVSTRMSGKCEQFDESDVNKYESIDNEPINPHSSVEIPCSPSLLTPMITEKAREFVTASEVHHLPYPDEGMVQEI